MEICPLVVPDLSPLPDHTPDRSTIDEVTQVFNNPNVLVMLVREPCASPTPFIAGDWLAHLNILIKMLISHISCAIH